MDHDRNTDTLRKGLIRYVCESTGRSEDDAEEHEILITFDLAVAKLLTTITALEGRIAALDEELTEAQESARATQSKLEAVAVKEYKLSLELIEAKARARRV